MFTFLLDLNHYTIYRTQICQRLELSNIVMPIKVDKLIQLLAKTNYDKKEIEYLKQGFTNGFDIGYRDQKLDKVSQKITAQRWAVKLSFGTNSSRK